MKPGRVTHFPAPLSRRGFSFTEVLFAVMILGVGFIMIAAIFPVAIQQTQNTGSEGNAAAIARGGVKFIEENLTSLDMPARGTPGLPGVVMSFRDAPMRGALRLPLLNSEAQQRPGNTPPRWRGPDQLWNKVRGNLILANDTRYAWVPLYRRDVLGTAANPIPSPYAQVFVVVTQVRNETADRGATSYSNHDVHTAAASAMVNLQARPVIVTIPKTPVGSTGQFIDIVPASQYAGAIAEGTYVIIADDNLAAPNTGRMNGRIYRIGNRDANTPNRWELMPGNDFVPVPRETQPQNRPAIDELRNATAYVVGRTLLSSSGTPQFAGIAQDVAVYTTFIQLR